MNLFILHSSRSCTLSLSRSLPSHLYLSCTLLCSRIPFASSHFFLFCAFLHFSLLSLHRSQCVRVFAARFGVSVPMCMCMVHLQCENWWRRTEREKKSHRTTAAAAAASFLERSECTGGWVWKEHTKHKYTKKPFGWINGKLNVQCSTTTKRVKHRKKCSYKANTNKRTRDGKKEMNKTEEERKKKKTPRTLLREEGTHIPRGMGERQRNAHEEFEHV